MAGIETGTEAVERLAKWHEGRADQVPPHREPHSKHIATAATLRALAAERDTLAEQLNAALADAVTLAHRLTSAEGERDAAHETIRFLDQHLTAAVAARVAAEGEVARLREALLTARGQFAFYAEQHHAKGTPDATKKARVNETMVARMDAALAAAEQGGDGQ